MAHWVGITWIVALSGCFGSHGAPGPSGDRDTGTMVPGDSTDAGVEADSAAGPETSPPPTTGIAPPTPSLCEAFAAGDPVEGLLCDPLDFEPCLEPIAGVPCCQSSTMCVDGVVTVVNNCDDDCAQGCRAVSEAASCNRYLGCGWLAETCDPPPSADIIAGPRCVGEQDRPCEDSDDCREGELCQPFWVNLCANGDCRGCGGTEQRFCTSH